MRFVPIFVYYRYKDPDSYANYASSFKTGPTLTCRLRLGLYSCTLNYQIKSNQILFIHAETLNKINHYYNG